MPEIIRPAVLEEFLLAMGTVHTELPCKEGPECSLHDHDYADHFVYDYNHNLSNNLADAVAKLESWYGRKMLPQYRLTSEDQVLDVLVPTDECGIVLVSTVQGSVSSARVLASLWYPTPPAFQARLGPKWWFRRLKGIGHSVALVQLQSGEEAEMTLDELTQCVNFFLLSRQPNISILKRLQSSPQRIPAPEVAAQRMAKALASCGLTAIS